MKYKSIEINMMSDGNEETVNLKQNKISAVAISGCSQIIKKKIKNKLKVRYICEKAEEIYKSCEKKNPNKSYGLEKRTCVRTYVSFVLARMAAALLD